jgi:hypothetical protein
MPKPGMSEDILLPNGDFEINLGGSDEAARAGRLFRFSD